MAIRETLPVSVVVDGEISIDGFKWLEGRGGVREIAKEEKLMSTMMLFSFLATGFADDIDIVTGDVSVATLELVDSDTRGGETGGSPLGDCSH